MLALILGTSLAILIVLNIIFYKIFTISKIIDLIERRTRKKEKLPLSPSDFDGDPLDLSSLDMDKSISNRVFNNRNILISSKRYVYENVIKLPEEEILCVILPDDEKRAYVITEDGWKYSSNITEDYKNNKIPLIFKGIK